jgi:hypothetical protein
MTQKKLPQDVLQDIREAVKGKLWCFYPVIREGGYGLGVSIANEAGYMPVPFYFFESDTYMLAEAEANRLNKEVLDMDEDAALDIVASSMAQGRVNERKGD